MPMKRQFEQGPGEPQGFYDTVFHEFLHWSESRLDWTASYELNELRAEIGSVRMANFVRIPNTDMRRNHDRLVRGGRD